MIGAGRDVLAPGADGDWVLRDAWGRVHARGPGAADWSLERRGGRVRIVYAGGGSTTAWSDAPFTLAPASATSVVVWNGRRYRGTIAFVPVDTAILVVNRLALESYLRGVVALELGARAPNESAAVEAQAVAARSYTVARVREAAERPYDLTSGPFDQVYGGMDAERPEGDAAVVTTAGMVLTYDGVVVRAPYHSTCGGRTVASTEAWSGVRDEPYLRGIRDTPPGSDRAWCEISPRSRWERTLDRRELEDAVARYVRQHEVVRLVRTGSGTGGAIGGGGVRSARIEGTTPSGRVATLALESDGGTVRLSGTELRTTLRTARGEILNSTYFSLEPVIGRDGRLMQLTLRGAGNGHGVGMCQWGAIARARAGHDVRAILAAYYPGTTVQRLP